MEGQLDTSMISSFGLNVHTLVSNTNASGSTEEGEGFGLALLDFVTELASRERLPQVLSLSLGSLSAFSCDLLCDQAVNALASNVIYFSFIPWFEGRKVDDIKQKLRMDLGPTYFLDCCFWPVTSYFNFKYVPVRHQLLCCNVVLLGWTLFMSYVCRDDALLRRRA